MKNRYMFYMLSQSSSSVFLLWIGGLLLGSNIIENRDEPASNPCTDRVLLALEGDRVVNGQVRKPVDLGRFLVYHDRAPDDARKPEQIDVRAVEVDHRVAVLLYLDVTDL